MLLRKKNFLPVLLLLLLSIAGCSGFPGCDTAQKNSPEKTQEKKETPKVIKDIETAALEIMQMANLIPLVEAESPKPEETAEKGGEEAGQKGGTEQEGGGSNMALTFEKTILGETIKRELESEAGGGEESKMPGDTEQAWDKIKMTVTELHGQWNELEPMLVEKKVFPEAISNFEEALDSLTISITEHDYFGTLTAANELTGRLSKIMPPFAENPLPVATDLKYHLRKILLNVASADYNGAQESLNYMKEHNHTVTSSLQEGEKKAEILRTSLDNLQDALNERNPGLINIKAAIVMEELAGIIKDQQ
jgi:hypothetical protein